MKSIMPKLIAFNMYETRIDKWHSENPYKKLFSTLWIEKHIANELSKTLMLSDVAIEDIVPRDTIDNKIFNEAIHVFYEDVSKQLSQLKIYPDFESTIQFLKNNGYQTAVVSNLSKLYAYPLDHMISKETFDYKALSFEIGTAKPDTKIFETLQEKSWISPKETVMIWDSFRADVQWAFAAWIQPIHINRSKEWITHHERYTQISRLKEIENILQWF